MRVHGASTSLPSRISLSSDSRDSRRHAAHARMMVVRRVLEERHVAGIQMQGVDQRQRFVVQCIDVARKPTVRVTASRTQ